MSSNRANNQALQELLVAVRQQGCEVFKRRNGHYKITTPSGTPVYCSSTPSDFRAVHKIRADLRRYGVHLAK